MNIWKFPLKTRSSQTIKMPHGAHALSVGVQTIDGEETICLWAIIDSNAPEEDVTFVIHGTGHEVSDRIIEHVGTVQIRGFVWHVFQAMP